LARQQNRTDGIGALTQAWCALWGQDYRRVHTMIDECFLSPESLDGFEARSLLVLLALIEERLDDARAQLPGLLATLSLGRAMELDADLGWLLRRMTGEISTETTQEVRTAVAERARQLRGLEEGRPGFAVVEIDRALADSKRNDVDRHALADCRAFVARYAQPATIEPDDWPLLFNIQMGEALVPSDAVERWQQWSLFTDLIPRSQEQLESRLGFPVMGVSVRASLDLAPRQFAVIMNGLTCRSKTIPGDTVPPGGKPLESYPPEFWEPAVSALEEVILADPAVAFVPRTVESMLDKWRALGSEAADVAARIDADLAGRILVWQTLRRVVQADGRLPDWDEGLRDLVVAAIDKVPSVASTARGGD
jgi:hypothetical protein